MKREVIHKKSLNWNDQILYHLYVIYNYLKTELFTYTCIFKTKMLWRVIKYMFENKMLWKQVSTYHWKQNVMTRVHGLYYILTKYSVTCLYKITCFIGYHLSFLIIFKYPPPHWGWYIFQTLPLQHLKLWGFLPNFSSVPPKQVFVNAPL